MPRLAPLLTYSWIARTMPLPCAALAGLQILFCRDALACWWRANSTAVQRVIAWLHHHALAASQAGETEAKQAGALWRVVNVLLSTCVEHLPDSDARAFYAEQILHWLCTDELCNLHRARLCLCLVHCEPFTHLKGLRKEVMKDLLASSNDTAALDSWSCHLQGVAREILWRGELQMLLWQLNKWADKMTEPVRSFVLAGSCR
ncbi:unnamed protein product [Symbiodinium natans]|uniref:Uncharacterized protein n=1 Tax=Symbiodinium natans TaxID=878477 RepID=A0A812RK79_9DINO|nr:unnamed protein product [Symbiodinium natans]